MSRHCRAARVNPARRAYLTGELIAVLGLSFLVLVLLAAGLLQYAQARRDADLRRTLRLAATDLLERMRSGVVALPAPGGDFVDVAAGDARPASRPDPARAPLNAPAAIRLAARSTPGQGPWSGFTRLQVRAARTVSGGRQIEFELAAYLPAGGAP